MPPADPTPAPPFHLAAVESAITGTIFAGHLHHLSSTPSTQTLALEAARSGARHGVWIADEQTAGRGRGAHTWHSAAGAGLLLSALLTPSVALPAVNRLSLSVALACQSAIAETAGFTPRHQIDIRWPNDLLLRGPASLTFRKVGGILIESSSSAAAPPTLRYAVVGIGLNVNHTHFPPDLDSIATSLRRESPDPTLLLSRDHLLAALLRHLDAEINRLVHEPAAEPSRDLTQYSSWLHGKHVSVPPDPLLPDTPFNHGYTGTTAGLTPEGFLRILADDGSARIVRSGGVRELLTPIA